MSKLESAPPAPADRVEQWSFAGRQCDPFGKSVQARYQRPDGSFAQFEITNTTRQWHRKIIGGLYDVEIIKAEAGERYRIAGAKYRGRLEDNTRVIDWQAADVTVDATIKYAKAVASSRNDALGKAMQPLQVAYRKLPAIQRPAFELWVLARLRRGFK